MSKINSLVGYTLLIVAMVLFNACSSSNDPNPTQSDELAGTVWISVTNLPQVTGKGEYTFSTGTKGVWKQKVAGVTVPFTTMNFTYVYKTDNSITITYYEDGGKKEVGTAKGNSLVLTKENGTVINYVKQ